MEACETVWALHSAPQDVLPGRMRCWKFLAGTQRTRRERSGRSPDGVAEEVWGGREGVCHHRRYVKRMRRPGESALGREKQQPRHSLALPLPHPPGPSHSHHRHQSVDAGSRWNPCLGFRNGDWFSRTHRGGERREREQLEPCPQPHVCPVCVWVRRVEVGHGTFMMILRSWKKRLGAMCFVKKSARFSCVLTNGTRMA